MEELKALLEKYLNENLELITLSAPRKGREELKARIRPVLLRRHNVLSGCSFVRSVTIFSSFLHKRDDRSSLMISVKL